jgi:hypothetical protein
VELVDRLESRRRDAHHQVGVAARAHERVGAQEVVVGEVVAGGRELALVAGPLAGLQAAPGGVQLEERELDEMPAGHAS